MITVEIPDELAQDVDAALRDMGVEGENEQERFLGWLKPLIKNLLGTWRYRLYEASLLSEQQTYMDKVDTVSPKAKIQEESET